MERIIRLIQDWFHKLNAGQRHRFIIICTIMFAALLTISVLISMSGSVQEELPGAPERLTIISPIPAEELFLPDEPDYLPGVLLERDRRSGWTYQDAEEYWQDPLMFGEEQWREKIENAIDEFLERVP